MFAARSNWRDSNAAPRSLAYGSMPAVDSRVSGGRRAIVLTYLVLGALAAIAIAVALAAGRDEDPTPSATGTYAAIGPAAGCLGTSFGVNQSGEFAKLDGAGDSGGSLRYRDGALRGTLDCRRGASAEAVLAIRGPADHRRLTGTIGAASFAARATAATPTAVSSVTSSPEELFGRLMLAMAVVLVAARLLGTAAGRIGQPAVMGEVLAGILLGATLLGALFPGLEGDVFPSDVVPLLTAGADI